MKPDPIITEIREIRHQISAKFNHNMDRLGEYGKRLDQELRQTGEFRFATGFFSTEAEERLPNAGQVVALAPANLRGRQKLTAKQSKHLAAPKH
jgi:hypothetical protein